MSNVSDLNKELSITPLLRLGFRPFFLLGSLFAVVAIGIWVLSLQGWLSFSPVNGILWWHAHEMLFGFVSAIIAGFLLTAVQTWTQVPSIKGNKLLILVLVWLCARLLILFEVGLPVWLVMAVDLTFLPLVGLFLAIPLIRVKQTRNMVFLPIIALMTLSNLLTYLPYLNTSAGLDLQWQQQGLHGMVMLVTLLVALLGGRVIPMFTANGTGTTKVLPIKYLELSALASLFILVVLFIAGFSEYKLLTGIVSAIAAVLHFYRNLRWRPWLTLGVPLVWVLHFTMLFIPLGLALMAIHFLFGTLSFSIALHSLTVGAIGGMILAMMSRVALGHTGRTLQVKPIMMLAFIAIIFAALVRGLLLAFMPSMIMHLYFFSGVLWCVAFACFFMVYLPILSKARIDGRPG